MCGIAGIVDFGGVDADFARPRMQRALARLAPRGPDGEGVWSDRRCLLGHRRLAIVDLSDAGSQPMVRDGLAITFNGMIYNYGGLRTELAAKGHSFSSDCDTEVLLAGWCEWGQGLLPRLVGMFAFAIWDAKAETLVLARDAFGKKPLFYAKDGGRAIFASELRALQHLDGKRGEVDSASLRLYLALRYVPEPRSILRGVGKVPPGCMVRITAGDAELEQWYGPNSGDPAGCYDDPSAAAAGLRALIDTAVADRLVADVPVGAFLSGGIDSAIVSACMVRHAPKVRTFTVGFEGAADYYEEQPAAKAVAEALGTDHTEITVTSDVVLSAIGPVFDGLDEPFADSSAIPTWLVSRETRGHVTVALSGDGADEVFGGYRKYQGELQANRYRRIPRCLRKGVIEPAARLLPESKTSRWSERARRLRRFLAHAGKEAVARQAGWMRTMNDDEVAAFAGPVNEYATTDELVVRMRDLADTDDPINQMLYADLNIGLPGDMLVKVDRMSMAHGLEVRCPMLDHRVVAAAFAMPGAWKLKAGRGKAILRDAFADMLPAEVFERPKRGFEIPIAQWLTGPLRDMTEAAIDPRRLEAVGLAATHLPATWLADLETRRRDTSEKLWTLIAFQAWAEREAAEGYGKPAV
jgi:asparagine synthase (glutamine-hydrolysing)